MMILRPAALVCAAALTASLAMPAQADSSRCEQSNFRIYFERASAQLDQAALETLNTAQRNVSGCAYAELHVAVDGRGVSANRGRAIVAAMHGRAWNVARVETQSLAEAAYGGPDYVQVMTTPNRVPELPEATNQEAGV